MGVIRRLALFAAVAAAANGQRGGELRFCLHGDPKTFDPLLANEEVSDTVRFLTGGVLVRFDRRTQRLEPELAASWKVLDNARRIEFQLRPNLKFSDGSPFTPADVVATVDRMMSPGLQSGVADSFRSAGGEVKARANGANGVTVTFSTPVGGLEYLFDQLAISGRKQPPESAVLGPFHVKEYKSGQYVLLERNPHYWKPGPDGRPLPNVDTLRLDIQSNRETELLRYRRGEVHLVDKMEPEAFERISKEPSSGAFNAGPSQDSEFLWFNQHPTAPIPAYKRRWFQSTLFRRAVSMAINRDDMIRLVYRGYAHAAAGPVSPANRQWFHTKLHPMPFDPKAAIELLKQEGFRLEGNTLRDRDGNPVEFSLITNAGSRTRSQLGTMVQQDLLKVGIRLNFTPMEFQSLVERITKTQQYESCLLGLANVELDPNSQMNVWLSSGPLHAWYPAEPKPATPWEAQIDQFIQLQHTSIDPAARKRAFDRVQEIVFEQQPIVYLVHPDVLVAISPRLRNVLPSPLPPHLYWNVEKISLAAAAQGRQN
jgi:peptide/nickel transport system substrate-binding protein